jgi:hypothetical protein
MSVETYRHRCEGRASASTNPSFDCDVVFLSTHLSTTVGELADDQATVSFGLCNDGLELRHCVPFLETPSRSASGE